MEKDIYVAAEECVEKFKEVDGITRIILYGSVARKETHAESDIDLALVLQDELRFFPPIDDYGHPEDLRDKIYTLATDLGKTCGHKIHAVLYYEDEFKKGIILPGKDQVNISQVGLEKYVNKETA